MMMDLHHRRLVRHTPITVTSHSSVCAAYTSIILLLLSPQHFSVCVYACGRMLCSACPVGKRVGKGEEWSSVKGRDCVVGTGEVRTRPT